MVKKYRGYTLVELMVVSAILAMFISLGSSLLMKINVFFRSSIGKIETQRDVRNVMTLITRTVRKAGATSVVISREDAAQPVYSKISFSDPAGDSYSIWQSGQTLYLKKNSSTTILSKNLKTLSFLYPSTTEPMAISILLTIEKTDETRRTQTLQMGGEIVRLLNN